MGVNYTNEQVDKLILEAISAGKTNTSSIMSFIRPKHPSVSPEKIRQRVWSLVDRGDLIFTMDRKFERNYRI